MADNEHPLVDALNVERFPMMVSVLEPKRLQRFPVILQQLADGLRLDAIPNPTLKEAKDWLNRVVHEAHDKLLNDFFYTGPNYPDPAPEAIGKVVYWGIPYLHIIPGRLKKLDALTSDHPALAKSKAFYRELLPLAESLELLKTKAVKKNAVPKPPEERKEVFEAPRASNQTVAMVFDLLKGITDLKYQELRSEYIQYARRVLQRYMDYVEETEKPKGPYSYYAKDPDLREIVGALVDDHITRSQPKAITIRDDVDAILDKMATQHADRVRATFLSRNLRKVAAIVDAKGNFKAAKVLDIRASSDGLRGAIHFQFEDGSDFVIRKSTVLSRSVHGTLFLRFPLTFHDVTMPDGSPMKQPSEERMNLVFAGRYYGMISAPKSEQLMLQSLGGVRLGAYDDKKRAFHAEATEEALRKLDELSADFPHDLKPRSFDELAEMTADGLAAELAWHAWAASLGDPLIYHRMHIPLDELNARLAELARAEQLDAAFGKKPAPAPSPSGPSL